MKKIIGVLFFLFTIVFLCGCEITTKDKTTEDKTTDTITTINPDEVYHKVIYSNSVTYAEMKVYYLDSDFNEHPITSGNDYPESFDGVSCTVKNTDSTKSILFAIFTGELLDDVYEIKPGEVKNVYHRQLTDDMELKVEEFQSYSISYSAIANTSIKIYDYSDFDNPKELESGTKVLKYTSIYPVVVNNTIDRVLLNVKYNDKTLIKTLDPEYEFESEPLRMLNDTVIETTILTGNSLSISVDPKYDADSLFISSYYIDTLFDENQDVEDGGIIPYGCKVEFTIYNDLGSSITLNITFNGKTLSYTVPVNDSGYQIEDEIIPTTDIVVEVN